MSRPNTSSQSRRSDNALDIVSLYKRCILFQEELSTLFIELKRFSETCQILESSEASSSDSIGECPICLENLFPSTKCKSSCGHMFHIHCLWDLFNKGLKQTKCPLCRGIMIPLLLTFNIADHIDRSLHTNRQRILFHFMKVTKATERLKAAQNVFEGCYERSTQTEKEFFKGVRVILHMKRGEPIFVQFINENDID